MKTNCWKCVYKRDIPGDAHISCAKPDAKMKGDPRGISQGWFFYPFNFDPIWMKKECSNFTEVKIYVE